MTYTMEQVREACFIMMPSFRETDCMSIAHMLPYAIKVAFLWISGYSVSFDPDVDADDFHDHMDILAAAQNDLDTYGWFMPFTESKEGVRCFSLFF